MVVGRHALWCTSVLRLCRNTRKFVSIVEANKNARCEVWAILSERRFPAHFRLLCYSVLRRYRPRTPVRGGLNELGEKFNLPIRFVEGFILSIEVAIPWTKPLTDNSVVEIDGLMMTVQPKQRVDDASMFEPMWGSMMSSMQLAEEYLRQEPLDKEDARAPAEPLAGLEQFAQAIETVFSRIKVRLTNTVLRVEHFPSPSSQQGVALELHIKSMDYYDQVSTEAGDIAGETIAQRVHERISLSTKRIILNGSSLYAEEFSLAREASSSLLPRSTAGNDVSPLCPTAAIPQHQKKNSLSGGPQELLAGCAGASPPLVAPSQESSAPEPEPILISQLMGQQEIRLQLKQDESLEGPNVDVDFSLGQLPLFLCPRQVHLLIQLAKGFSCPSERPSLFLAAPRTQLAFLSLSTALRPML
ncbi:hypothetical protein HPB48_023347 [Haemaphysalis longicornis]|uniref:Autophagy-related protein 2 n=1 Tax=Haemaphysalis longicornis TaxID=44386 RepID=A0A9J6H6R4_HAELO|nr:hypothetical protein HPB48_023347 [Haemaphysalis longicornis]